MLQAKTEQRPRWMSSQGPVERLADGSQERGHQHQGEAGGSQERTVSAETLGIVKQGERGNKKGCAGTAFP